MAKPLNMFVVITVAATLALASCAVPVTPLETSVIDTAAETLIETVAVEQEPIRGPIDIYEAMARAIKYNLDYQIEAVQTSLRTAEFDLSNLAMLPSVVANTGIRGRNVYSASSSLNLSTGTENFAASTSQDKRLKTADIEFSWSILDFGLSYVRARQAADKALIGEELKRKAMQRIVEDVRAAYARAYSLERLSERMRQLEGRAVIAQENAGAVASSNEVSKVAALTKQRELIEVQRRVKDIKRELMSAKSQLAALMNVPPGIPFTLKKTRWPQGPSPDKLISLQTAIDIAVKNRPEVRENLYQQRINVNECHAALLDLLPGLRLTHTSNYDSNSFLLSNNWTDWGSLVSSNLIKVFMYPVKADALEKQGELLSVRARALTMAIMTQVHVSHIRYVHFTEELRIAANYRDVENKLVQQIRLEAAADAVSEQTLIREELNALVGEAQYDIANAGVQSALANMTASMGLDINYSALDVDRGVGAIAEELRWAENTGAGADATPQEALAKASAPAPDSAWVTVREARAP
ncbi:MAG: TolC family protein [Hyphomicrobium sp.]